MTRHDAQFTFPGFHAREIRTQYAALCYRITRDKPQILLVTSRGTRRWIPPKGWPMKKLSPGQAALREAHEEAGVIGQVNETPLGIYRYMKLMNDGSFVPCIAVLFPVQVKRLETKYREMSERQRKWMSRKKAAELVAEPELARLIRDFKPGSLRH